MRYAIVEANRQGVTGPLTSLFDKDRYLGWLGHLTLPLPISHLRENYLPLPISHLCEFHMCTRINFNGDISLHAWLKIANQNGQCHARKALLHF